MEELIDIRASKDSDLDDILSVERIAFGRDDEAELVKALLDDPSAKPILSLLAFKNNHAVGHILFTTARLIGPRNNPSIVILAPLAVVPDAQNQGIGGRLIKTGLRQLSKSGVDLVFVLGHPRYYSRHGFSPAGRLGFEAPHPIPDEHADAWMVQALRARVIDSVSGKVICSDELGRPEHWRE